MLQNWLFRIVLFLYLFICFLSTPHLPEGIFTAKEIGLYFATFIASIAAMYFVVSGNIKMKIDKIDIAVFMYLIGIPTLQWFALEHIALSAWIQQVCLFLCYFSIRILCSSTRLIYIFNIVGEAVIITLFFSLIIAVAQKNGLISSAYEGEITGLFFNPGPFAIHLAALVSFSFPLLIFHLQKRNYFLVFVLVTFITISLYFIVSSMSRSAWIGIFAAGITTLFFFMHWRFNSREYRLYKSLWIVIAVSVCLCVPVAIKAYSLKKDSADGRLLIWNASMLMGKEHMLAGVGIDKFTANYIVYQAKVLALPENKRIGFSEFAGDVRYAFNDFLQIFAEKGLVGVVVFLSILLLLIIKLGSLWRQQRALNHNQLIVMSIVASILCILTSGFTSYPMQIIPISVLFWVMIALLVSVLSNTSVNSIHAFYRKWAYISVFFVGGFIIGIYGFNRAKAYMNWKRTAHLGIAQIEVQTILVDHPVYLFHLANQAMRGNEYSRALDYLKRTISYGNYPQYYYTLGACYEELNQPSKALACYESVRAAIPNLLTPNYLKAKLYYRFGNILKFKEVAGETLAFKPKINSDQVRRMKLEVYELLKILGK